MEPAFLGGIVFRLSGAPVRVEAVDGGSDDGGQYVCFDAVSETGEAVAQVRIRDAGEYQQQKDAAVLAFRRLGFVVAPIR